ncbi:hypothetical protein AMJ57_03425 [Parcubacteria bacterium SG8_24]|nr:MAG: hypothetical protein AMJ57_03425 [Parcubacteria bacterium SG8_24]
MDQPVQQENQEKKRSDSPARLGCRCLRVTARVLLRQYFVCPDGTIVWSREAYIQAINGGR